MATDWAADVKKYAAKADDAVIAAIVRYCGIALRNRDSALVAFSDPKELDRVRNNYLKKKLGRTEADDVLNAAIAKVGEKMKADRTRNRVTVYYLLADHFKALSVFAPKAKAAAAAPAKEKAPAKKTATAKAAGVAAVAAAGAATAKKPAAKKAEAATAKPAAAKKPATASKTEAAAKPAPAKKAATTPAKQAAAKAKPAPTRKSPAKAVAATAAAGGALGLASTAAAADKGAAAKAVDTAKAAAGAAGDVAKAAVEAVGDVAKDTAGAAADVAKAAAGAAGDVAKAAVDTGAAVVGAAGAAAAVATGAAGKAASAVSESVHGLTGSSDDKDSGLGWLWWLLAFAVLLFLAWWFFLRGPAEDAQTVPASATAADSSSAGTAATGTDLAAAPAEGSVTIPSGAGVTTETRDGKPVVKVYFDTAKVDVVPDFAATAGGLKAWLDSHPGSTLAISGYADPSGNAALNAELAKKRAQAVQAALVGAGIPEGSAQLVKPENVTDATVAKDAARRVEVVVK